jgi:hypothetical protein
VDGKLYAAKDDNDPRIVMTMLGLLAALVLLSILGAYLGLGWVVTIVLVVIVALGGAIAIGAYIGFAESKAIDSCYAKRTSQEIAAFLERSGYRRADFDDRAAIILDETATLRRFLFRTR